MQLYLILIGLATSWLESESFPIIDLLPMSKQICRQTTTTRTMSNLFMSKLSGYESLLEFNAQFKQGLKYILAPQLPPTGTRPLNYYDGTIPDVVDAPIQNSVMDYTSVATTSTNSATTTTSGSVTSLLDLSQLNVNIPSSIHIPTTSDILSATMLDSINTNIDFTTLPKVVVNTEKIDAMSRDVSNVLLAAKSVVSSTVEIASNSKFVEVASVANAKIVDVATVANTKIVDPVVDRTMAEIKYAISHPPDFTGYTFQGGAPPGQGLATPLLDYISRTLQTAQEAPPLFFADPLPDDYRTIQFGFQAKDTAIEQVQQIQNSIYESAQQIAAKNEMLQGEIQKVMTKEFDQIQQRNAIIAEKVVAQSQSNLDYIHDVQVMISNQIVDNAHQIQDHIPEQMSTMQLNIMSAIRNSNFYESAQLNKVVASLKIDELGGWYTGAILGLILLQLAHQDKINAIKVATTKINMETQMQLEQANIEKQRLEGMVVELTQAVAILTSELRMLKEQRIRTDTVLASVQNDVKNVVSEQLLESLAQNEVLRQQLQAAATEVSLLKQSSNPTEYQPRPPQSPPPIVENQNFVSSLESAFFASTRVNKNVATPSIPKVTKASSSAKPRNDDDWSTLPLSAIKRKPITEIMSYLQGKGRNVIGKDGRPLSKSQLVEAIFSF